MENQPTNTVPPATKPAAPTGKQPAQHHSGGKYLFIAVGVILVALAAAGLYASKHQKKPAPLPSPWATYSSPKYGFKFNYLRSWGSPIVQAGPIGAGKKYYILFNKQTAPKAGAKYPPASVYQKQVVSVTMDSSDATVKFCESPTSCVTQPPFTADAWQSEASNPTMQHYTSNPSSYSTIATYPQANKQSVLDIYRLISLPSLKVGALHGSFVITGNSPDCYPNTLENSGSDSCVSVQNFNGFSKFIDSISKN